MRLFPKFGYNYSSFQTPENALVKNWNTKQQDFFRPSDLLGYEHVPNRKQRTNSYGLVSKEYDLKKDKGVYRILILGDSIAEQKWSADFLEEELNKNKSLGLSYRFEIWNAGVGGYDVRRYALFLKYKGLAYNPDMVIVFLFMNDFGLDTLIYYRTENGVVSYNFYLDTLYKKGFRVSPFMMQHSNAYRYAVLKFRAYLEQTEKDNGINKSEDNGKYYLGRIKEMCEKRKIPLYIVIFPYLKDINEYSPYQRNEYITITKVLKEMRLDYIDLHSFYDRLIKERFDVRQSKKDDMHPNKEVHIMIGKILYDYLLDNHLFMKK